MTRRGSSLMELMAAMAVNGVLVAFALVVLQNMLRCQADVRAETQARAARTRLAECLRADVHAAVQGQPLGAAGRACQLVGADGRRVEYRIEAQRVVRSVRRHDKLVQQDAFMLPAGARATCEIPAAVPGVVRLRVVQPDQPADRPVAPSWCVEAALAPRARMTIEEPHP